ncbi:MAG: hypothetical protein HQ572_03245 [Candidatus Omnitrophica bacterium]|nr:hypothetical protein [Candidatus Omnitrophota bacterium]
MKKLLVVLAIVCFISSSMLLYAAAEEQLILECAREDRKAMVAVEAHLTGNILTTRVSASMEDVRPSITNIIIVGPKIGRLVPKTIKQLYATLEDQGKEYNTYKIGGFIGSSKPKTKSLTGSITRKIATFEIPVDKIERDGKYQLKVKVSAAKQAAGKAGRITRFIFDLDKLAEALGK